MATIGDISTSDKINISPITNTHRLEGVHLPTNNNNQFNNEMRESGAEDGDGSSSNMILDDKLLDDTSSPGGKSLEVGEVVQKPSDFSSNDKTITSTNTINQTSNDMRKTEDSNGDGDGSGANIILDGKPLDESVSPGDVNPLEIGTNVVQQPPESSTNTTPNNTPPIDKDTTNNISAIRSDPEVIQHTTEALFKTLPHSGWKNIKTLNSST